MCLVEHTFIDATNSIMVRSVLSVFIDLRHAECVLIPLTSCLLVNKQTNK